MTTLQHCRQLLTQLRSSLTTLSTETTDQGDREAIRDAEEYCGLIEACLDDVNHAGRANLN